MKDFLNVSGAIAIGLIFVSVVTFPWLAIGVIAGYMFIKEGESKPEDKVEEKKD